MREQRGKVSGGGGGSHTVFRNTVKEGQCKEWNWSEMLSSLPKERQWASHLETWVFILNELLAIYVILSKVFSFWVLISSSRKLWVGLCFLSSLLSSEILISPSFFFSCMFLVEGGDFVVFKQTWSIHKVLKIIQRFLPVNSFLTPTTAETNSVGASPHLKGGSLVFCCL